MAFVVIIAAFLCHFARLFSWLFDERKAFMWNPHTLICLLRICIWKKPENSRKEIWKFKCIFFFRFAFSSVQSCKFIAAYNFPLRRIPSFCPEEIYTSWKLSWNINLALRNTICFESWRARLKLFDKKMLCKFFSSSSFAKRLSACLHNFPQLAQDSRRRQESQNECFALDQQKEKSPSCCGEPTIFLAAKSDFYYDWNCNCTFFLFFSAMHTRKNKRKRRIKHFCE